MTDKDNTGNTATKRNVAELLARNTILESEIKIANTGRDEAVSQLKEANDLIEADTKARLVEKALAVTTMSLVELAGKDIDTLETIVSVAALTKKNRFESGADLGGTDDAKFNAKTYLHGFYVGNRRKD